MDRILIILKKENSPRASSALALGLNTIIFKHVYWYMQQTQVSVYRTIGPLVLLEQFTQINCHINVHFDIFYKLYIIHIYLKPVKTQLSAYNLSNDSWIFSQSYYIKS